MATNLSKIQRQVSEIYNYVSTEFQKTQDKKTQKILDRIFRKVHSILKDLSEIKTGIKNFLEEE